jgi:hypothetical protein
MDSMLLLQCNVPPPLYPQAACISIAPQRKKLQVRVEGLPGLLQTRNIIADSRAVLEVMPQKSRFLKEDTHRHREDVMNSLTRVIAAIDTVKDLVPIAIGKTILSAASTILLVVRVNPWSIVRNRSLNGLPFSQDTMKNKEDFRDLIDQCNKIGELINRTIWEISEEQISPMLDEALENLAR